MLLLASRTAISYWVDLLWFSSLGYGQVFWTTLGLEWGVFAGFAAVTFVILLGVFLALERAHREDLPATHTILFAGQSFNLPVATVLRVIGIAGSLLIALVTGAAMEAQWPQLALYWYAPAAAGTMADPIFGRGLNSPVHAAGLADHHRMAAVAGGDFDDCRGRFPDGVRRSAGAGRTAEQRRRAAVARVLALRWISAAGGCTAGVYQPFRAAVCHHTIFNGVTYTDAHVNIFGLLIVSAALVLGAPIAIASGVLRPTGRWLARRWRRSHLLCRGGAGGLVRDNLRGQAQPTGS